MSTTLAIELSNPTADQQAELAAVAFLARYSGRTLESYRYDLRSFFQWAADVKLDVLGATRPHIELFRSCWRSEAWQPRPSTGGCRPSAGSTDLLTSKAGLLPTLPSTSAARGCTAPKDAGSTARNSGGSSLVQRPLTMITPLSRSSSG